MPPAWHVHSCSNCLEAVLDQPAAAEIMIVQASNFSSVAARMDAQPAFLLRSLSCEPHCACACGAQAVARAVDELPEAAKRARLMELHVQASAARGSASAPYYPGAAARRGHSAAPELTGAPW